MWLLLSLAFIPLFAWLLHNAALDGVAMGLKEAPEIFCVVAIVGFRSMDMGFGMAPHEVNVACYRMMVCVMHVCNLFRILDHVFAAEPCAKIEKSANILRRGSAIATTILFVTGFTLSCVPLLSRRLRLINVLSSALSCMALPFAASLACDEAMRTACPLPKPRFKIASVLFKASTACRPLTNGGHAWLGNMLHYVVTPLLTSSAIGGILDVFVLGPLLLRVQSATRDKPKDRSPPDTYAASAATAPFHPPNASGTPPVPGFFPVIFSAASVYKQYQRFEPMCLLGSGRFGTVWLMRNPDDDELVVFKRVLLPTSGLESIVESPPLPGSLAGSGTISAGGVKVHSADGGALWALGVNEGPAGSSQGVVGRQSHPISPSSSSSSGDGGQERAPRLAHHSSADAERWRCVEREVRNLASLAHPNIIKYLACFPEGSFESFCLVTEYAGGGTLKDVVWSHARYDTPIETRCIVLWMQQLAAALLEVHAKHIMHRDIKPANVMLTAAGEEGLANSVIKLGDFGLSSAPTESSETMVGTPLYMSPERFLRDSHTAAADVWGVGCVLFELLALAHPFEAPTLAQLMEAVTTMKYDEAALARAPHPHALKVLAAGEGLLHRDPLQRMSLPAMLRVLDDIPPSVNNEGSREDETN